MTEFRKYVPCTWCKWCVLEKDKDPDFAKCSHPEFIAKKFTKRHHLGLPEKVEERRQYCDILRNNSGTDCCNPEAKNFEPKDEWRKEYEREVLQ